MMGDIYAKLALDIIFLAQDVEEFLNKMIMNTEMLEMDIVRSVLRTIKVDFVFTVYQIGQSDLSLIFSPPHSINLLFSEKYGRISLSEF